MTIRDRRAMEQTARERLAAGQDQLQPLLLIYLAIITGLSLAASILTVVLTDRIADTGGLSNMGLRSVLSTAQTLLPLVQTLVLWGLQVGYHTAALGVARGEPVSRDTLFGGFRRFFPMLRAMLMQGLMYGMTGMTCMYLAVYIFLLLPVSGAFQEAIMPAIQSASILSGTITLDETAVAAASAAVMPALWIFAGLFLLVFVPMYYNFRLTLYRIIDHSRPRALLAMMESRALLRRGRLQLLKVDLRLWWYYLLQLLAPMICYGDVLLALAGITLPIPEMASYFLFLILSLAAQFAVCYFFMNRVSVTYAVFYDTVLAEKMAQVQQPPVPAQNPWQDSDA